MMILMTPDEPEQTESTNQDGIIKKKKEKIEESEFRINMNPWGVAFMILFIAVLGYLVISLFVYLPPFEYDVINSEYIISDGLLTILCISALIFLALGIYFGWIKKTEEPTDDLEEIDDEEEETKEPVPEKQITFVYVKSDDNKKEG
jgi:amino acid permease